MRGLRHNNMGRAGAVVDGDAEINALENEIDSMALTLLVRNQPVAQDLRFTVAALRMVIDLERIGDEAANIAERAMILHEELPEPVLDAVGLLMADAVRLYAEAVAVFREEDAEKALQICRNDDESTQLEVTALHRIMDYFCPDDDNSKNGKTHAGMHGILICRALNRICRRAANIAEHTYFYATGVNIKHALLPVRES